ncbi:dihydrofolate reductase family protein [Paramicrobacterium humi]|uniref:dihydrofolate reductase family protein n=1 Tax=Paramicrobacterium humi TaxID=640635 RepID=UPI002481F553|nr:dihydrofolate reductase family protein [Microbacterium humi]
MFGPTTAREAICSGMVDDFRFFVVPMAVGAGLRALPDHAHLDLELVEHRIFGNGTAYLHYRPRRLGTGGHTETPQEALVSRVRSSLAEVPTHREVSMFGGELSS